jgi:hypothetical protein
MQDIVRSESDPYGIHEENERHRRALNDARYEALIEAACIADGLDFNGGVPQMIADALRKRAEEVKAGTANPFACD